jgi:hypothetical protein
LSQAPAEEIKNYLDGLREETDAIENQCMEVAFHMKGVTWNEVWGMSPEQRGKIIRFVNKIYQEREASQTGKTQM